jgi:putative addiction module component (TIGR02574 family)
VFESTHRQVAVIYFCVMSTNAEKILQEAMRLPAQDRAEVLERLLATFQEPPDPELDRLWAREVEDRLEAYDRGEVGSVPADEVFARIERQRGK